MAVPDNRNDPDYDAKLQAIARDLRGWQGPIVLVAHVDPDGDALGSTLALKRALDTLGKTTVLPVEAPPYLRFLVDDGELSPPLASLPEGALLAVLDVAELSRVVGAPTEGAAFVVNVDHHGTNERFGDRSLVQPGAAATAQIVKDLIDALGVPWTPRIALPCLTGLMTDTGTFRYANTTGDVLRTAAALIDVGVDYVDLADRLQWRPKSYFTVLGRVMETIEFPAGGRVTLATVPLEAQALAGPDEDASDDFVGVIRYVEGSLVAVLLKQKDDAVKVSVRARAPVSAQRICVDLGGGGHVAAAGAKITGRDLAAARTRVMAAVEAELARHDLPR